jgi:hypothetical protein
MREKSEEKLREKARANSFHRTVQQSHSEPKPLQPLNNDHKEI